MARFVVFRASIFQWKRVGFGLARVSLARTYVLIDMTGLPGSSGSISGGRQ